MSAAPGTAGDLGAIVADAENELLVARAIESDDPPPGDGSTLGYYEAELVNLRDAAASLAGARLAAD